MHPSTPRTSSSFQKPQARGPLFGAMTGDQQVPFQNQPMAAFENGGKIKGPGTATSDSVQAQVQQTGEPIAVSTGERILSASQDQLMQRLSKAMGFPSVDAFLAAGTGKPVGPTVKGGKLKAATGMAPLDPQAASDQQAASGAWNTIKGVNKKVGAAIADVATLLPRGVAGAYDTAVVRPMRAAGVNAAYTSPLLAPTGSDPASQTPFTDALEKAPEPGVSTKEARTSFPVDAQVNPQVVGIGSSGPKAGVPFSSDAKVSPEVVANAATSPTYSNGAPSSATGAVTQVDSNKAVGMINGVMGRPDGGDASTNAGQNIRGLAGDMGKRDTYNEAQKLQGSNVRAMSDGKGGLLLTGAVGNDAVSKAPYLDTAGNPTSDFSKTARHAEGLADAANARRMLDSMTRDRLTMEAGSAIKGYSIPAKAQLEQMDKAQAAQQVGAVNSANIDSTRATTAASKLRLQQEQQQNDLMQEFLHPSTTDERKSQISDYLMLGKPNPNANKVTAVDGGVDPTTGLKNPGVAIVQDAKGRVSYSGSGSDAASKLNAPAPKKISTKAEFEKLKAGDIYVGTDGKTYRK